MTSLISNIDDYITLKNTMQHGENNHPEYKWGETDDTQDIITKFYFQLVRSNDNSNLEKELNKMLIKFSEIDTETGEYKYKRELINLYSLLGHTRDIVNGKGEYELAYMQLYVWYSYFPTLAVQALQHFVRMGDETEHPYGSWKDIKKMCGYVKQRLEKTNVGMTLTEITNHGIIKTAIHILLSQFDDDIKNIADNKPVSLASKWCPRENSQYKWLYNAIIKQTPFYHKYMKTAISDKQKKLAFNKVKTQFRKMVSSLNKYISTTEINMCGKNWKDIDFNKVPSKSMNIYKYAFNNMKKGNCYRDTMTKYPDNEDRIECAKNYNSFINKVINKEDGADIKGKRLDTYELVKGAFNCPNSDKDNVIYKTINSQWDTNRLNNKSNIGNIIPMVDTSGSMTVDNCIPLYNAIGLGIRVSECTNDLFKNRVLTFSKRPTWINLEKCDTFVDKVHSFKRADAGYNTNFYNALKLILDVIIKNNTPPEEVEDMTLAIFSDMQIDECCSGDVRNTMFDNINKMYRDAGYYTPHILFWNLQQTKGFPLLTSDKNATMLSGFSSVLLNEFSDKGTTALKDFTPYKMVCEILEKERYQVMRDNICELLKL